MGRTVKLLDNHGVRSVLTRCQIDEMGTEFEKPTQERVEKIDYSCRKAAQKRS